MEEESDSDEYTPPEITEATQVTTSNLLPEKSKKLYESAYDQFLCWRKKNQKKDSFSEKILMAYIDDLAKKSKPTTLLTHYSMLRSTIYRNHSIDISKYLKLKALLKTMSEGYKPKKAKILTTQEIDEFIARAPDEKFLFVKVALIFGISGACRKKELVYLTVDDIEDLNSAAIIKIENRKSQASRKFMITGLFYAVYKKYANLRPETTEKRFFLNYQNGKCTRQVVGHNKIGGVPKVVAIFLKLDHPELYTGHCFRRSSVTIPVHAGGDLTTLKRQEELKPEAVEEVYVDSIYKQDSYYSE